MTSTAGCREIRQSLGVYVLGAIDPAERALVEDHLATCLDCREELAALAGLPALLRKVPVTEAERLAAPESDSDSAPSQELLRSLLARTTQVRRVRRSRGLTAAAAVVLVALGGGAVAMKAFEPPAAPVAQSHRFWHKVAGTDALSGAKMTVMYTPVPWGTEMNVQVNGVPAGTLCQIKVIDAAGRQQTVGDWRVSYTGGPAWYPASTAVTDDNLRTFELTSGGRVLAALPVPISS